MRNLSRTILNLVVATIVGAAGLMIDERVVLLQSGSLTTTAEARVGRPATPVSYAGVARRTTSRAVATGAAVGAAAATGTTCVQAVDVYGRIYTRCY